MAKKSNGTNVMRIEYVALSEVQRWPRNPKLHDEEGIQRSIGALGFNDPPTVDERTGRLIEGHGRVEALQEMKREGKEPPARIQVRDDGEWLVPIVRGVSFESEAQAEQYLLAHNRLVENGGWDEKVLNQIMQDLSSQEVSMAGLGWTEQELSDLNALATLDQAQPEAHSTGKNIDERFEGYATNEIKQIVIYLGHEEYDAVLARMKAQMESRGLQSHTEVILAALSALEASDDAEVEDDVDVEPASAQA